MTIGSSNISFSTIASEKGIGNSNLSLSTLSSQQSKLDIADNNSASSQYGTFTQTWTYGGSNSNRVHSTVTSAQGQGTNGLNASPYSMSEWAGLDPIANTSLGNNGTPVVRSSVADSGTSCFLFAQSKLELYCYKSGSTIYIKAYEYSTSPVTARNGSNSSTSLSNGATTIATITAGTGQQLPTGCSMSYTTGTSTGTGGFFGSGAQVYTGGTNSLSSSTTNLGSTKIGYGFKCGGTSEGAGNTVSGANFRFGCRFNWTISGIESCRTEVWGHLIATATHQGGFFGC